MKPADEADSNRVGEKEAIAASWAPADPRDKLYDAAASSAEKTGSLFRIIAAFHPVLNIPVLLYDSVRQLGWWRAGLLWLIFIMALVGVALVISL